MGKKPDRTEEIIKKSVLAAVLAAQRAPKEAYKATEKRLYALPIIRQRLEDNKDLLEELLLYGPKQKSKSITRFTKSGGQLSPDEIFDAVRMDMEASIASDEEEIRVIEAAYSKVENDPYAYCVAGRYFEEQDDDYIASRIGCEKSTVWRNRNRLVQKISVYLYGAAAVR